jgi:hypothetical protein
VAIELETATSFDTAPAERDTQRAAAERHLPAIALGLIVVGTFLLYTLLTTGVDGPRVHPDEELYTMGASSLAAGEGLTLRGQHFGFGPLFPMMLAAIIRLAGSVDAAYDWFKAANAFCFALTAVPVYLLARRVTSAWWAVVAAGLSIAIPSSISTGTIMTESLSYLATAWALYAMAITLDRPSVIRQFAVLAAIAAAFLTRPQFGVLYGTWIGSLAVFWLIAPWARPRTRTDLLRLWPTALPLVLALVAFCARLASGGSASGSFGAYSVLWRGYSVLDVGKWFVYHLGDFTVYLAVVPVAVAPIVLWTLGRAGRAGSRPAAAFVALFAAANLSGLLVVAAFASTPWGFDRLHDRYGFYLLPLWLIGFVVWLDSGLPRPLLASAIGVVAVVAFSFILPFGQLANEAGIDTVPGALWERIAAESAGPGPASGSLALALFVVGIIVATLVLPRRIARVALPLAVATTFAAMSYFAWERMVGAPEDLVYAGGFRRAWIDDRVSKNATVTKFYADTNCGSALQRHAIYLTEFFNSTVDRAAYLRGSVPDGLPIERVDVARSGELETAPGKPLVADYVFTQPGIELAGRRVAEGTAARLVLWHVGGPVRVVGATSNAQLRQNACP